MGARFRWVFWSTSKSIVICFNIEYLIYSAQYTEVVGATITSMVQMRKKGI